MPKSCRHCSEQWTRSCPALTRQQSCDQGRAGCKHSHENRDGKGRRRRKCFVCTLTLLSDSRARRPMLTQAATWGRLAWGSAAKACSARQDVSHAAKPVKGDSPHSKGNAGLHPLNVAGNPLHSHEQSDLRMFSVTHSLLDTQGSGLAYENRSCSFQCV